MFSTCFCPKKESIIQWLLSMIHIVFLVYCFVINFIGVLVVEGQEVKLNLNVKSDFKFK